MLTFSSSAPRRATLLLLALLVVSCCGCVEKSTSGSTTTFYNALWATAACVFGGLAGGVAGWYLRAVSERLGWALMIGGVVLVLGVTPTVFFEKTTVREDGFFVRSGLWGTSSFDVKYAETAHIDLTMEVTRGRRGSRNTHYYLVCQQKSGEAKKIPMGGACKEAAPLILVGASAHGIMINDNMGGYE
jgi:hypothetical protein